MVQKKKSLLERLKVNYKIVFLNDDTFEEKAAFTLNRLNVFIVSSLLLVMLITLVTSILIFTPLKEYIPGYADVSLRRDISQMSLKVDSLEGLLSANDQFIENINQVISGKAGSKDTLNIHTKPQLIDTNFRIGAKPAEDSMLRMMIEDQNQYGIAAGDVPKKVSGIAGYSFFTPAKGSIKQQFNTHSNHFGIDIATAKGETIKAALEGTVVFGAWTTENGYVIAIQHSNDLVSIYKHNAVLLKKVGNFVRVGEPVAIVGATGELSNGPHLHFELWYRGNAVNPLNYIHF